MVAHAIRRPRGQVKRWAIRVAGAIILALVDACAPPELAVALSRIAEADGAAAWAAIAPLRAIRSWFVSLTGCSQSDGNPPALCP
jgi:hypothetical protein